MIGPSPKFLDPCLGPPGRTTGLAAAKLPAAVPTKTPGVSSYIVIISKNPYPLLLPVGYLCKLFFWGFLTNRQKISSIHLA
jgi:hypothetical protein